MLDNRFFVNTSQAYLSVLRATTNGYVVCPRGKPTREVNNAMFTVLEPTSGPIVTKDPKRNAIIADYTKKEFRLYNSMTDRVEKFGKASKFWYDIANEDGSINSAYGARLLRDRETRCGLTQWEWCKTQLLRDHDTRQAFFLFSRPYYQYLHNKDQICTMHGVFSIRHRQLHLSVVMRSNDVVRGLVYDMPWFCSLIKRMRDELVSAEQNWDGRDCPAWGDEPLFTGQYTHLAHSLHLYERDLDKAMLMLGETTCSASS